MDEIHTRQQLVIFSFNMPNNIFQEIDSLHSEWERMDKSAKLGWLTGKKMRLNGLANQFARYISFRGGFANADERASASKLLEMINDVDAEGAKVAKDIVKDAIKEMVKSLMR